MRVVGFVAATAALITTGFLIVVRLRLRSTLDALLAWLVVSIAVVVGLVLLVGGVLRSLRPGSLVGAALVLLALTIWVVTRGDGLRVGWVELRERVQRTLRDVHPRDLVRQHPFACVLMGLATLSLAWDALGALLLPPLAYDSLVYHLPPVAYWVQHGEIARTPFGVYANFYPFNAETLTTWSATLLKSDAFANSVQIPFAFCGALGTALLARIVGLRRVSAALAASLFFLSPIVAQQAKVAYVDLALAGAFLAALAFALRGLQCVQVVQSPGSPAEAQGAVRYLVLAGLAAGVACGIKEAGPLYAGVLFLLVAGGLLAARRRPTGLRGAGRMVCGFLVPVLLLGTFWFVRNTVDYGNPFHPWDVSVAGVTLVHGERGASSEVLRGVTPAELADLPTIARPLVSWAHEPKGTYLYDDRLGGFGVIWLLVALPSLVGFAIWCVRRRRDLLVTFLVPVAVVFALQPDDWWSRFTIVLLGPGLVAVAFAYEWIAARRRLVAAGLGALVCVLALQQLVATRVVNYITPRGVLHQAKVLATDGYVERSQFVDYAVANALERLPSDTTVATKLREVPHQFVYPLMGGNFQHNLVILRGRGEQQLRHELDGATSVGAVVTRRGSALDRAVRAQPNRFALIARPGANRVYRVL